MSAQPAPGPRFVRKTDLAPTEYRKNFKQIDDDVIEAVTSAEADEVTPLMAKIYLRLLKAPPRYWERAGVLRFEAEIQGDERVKAWTVMCELLRASSATVNKALRWMHEQGIIGYFSGKNGVGIRIFLNRAVSSVGTRPTSESKKILPFPPASSKEARASSGETAFKESFAILENSDSDLIPHAPETGAAEANVGRELSDPNPASPEARAPHPQPTAPDNAENHPANVIDSATVVEQVKREVASQVRSATAQEHERTREWFITHALPKAIRVAQRSAYDVLRAHGVLNEPRSHRSSGGRNYPDDRQVGKHTPTEITPRLLSDEEITELAESCVALLVTQGQTIDRSLSEMSVEAGGFLLSEDASKVRARAEVLNRAGAVNQNSRREGNGF